MTTPADQLLALDAPHQVWVCADCHAGLWLAVEAEPGLDVPEALQDELAFAIVERQPGRLVGTLEGRGSDVVERALRLAAAIQARPVVPPCTVALHAAPVGKDGAREVAERMARLAGAGDLVATETVTRLAGPGQVFQRSSLGGSAIFRKVPRARVEPPFVGRETELLQLSACWAAATRGRPLMVRLSGAPGMGRSRLVHEFLRQVELDHDVHLFVGRPHMEQEAFGLVRDVLESRWGLDETALREALGPWGGDWLHLLGLAPAPGGLSASHRQFRAFRALTERLLECLSAAPTLLVIEDAHWLDEGSLSWLDTFIAEAALEARSLPVLIVVTEWAGEGRGRLMPHGLGHVGLALGPLSEGESREIVASLSPRIPEEIRLELARHARGNPLLLREFAHQVAAGSAVGEELSEGLRQVLTRRLAALGPVAQRVLVPAAILGPVLELGPIRSLAGAEDVRIGLTALRDAQLLLPLGGGDRWEFAHPALHQVAYEAIDEFEREEWHLRAARVLVEQGSPAVEAARQFARSRSPELAWPYYMRAAEQARALADPTAACAAIEAALGLPRVAPESRLVARLELAECLLAAGQASASLVPLQEVGMRLEGAERFRWAMLEVQAYERMGELAQAEGRIQVARNALAPSDLAGKGRVQLVEASLRLRKGALAECLNLAERALEMLSGDAQRERALAYSLRGIARYRIEGPQAAVDSHSRALALREQLADPAAVGASLSNLGVAYYELGRWPDARAAFDRAREAFLQVGEQWPLTVVLNNEGHLHLNQGHLDVALERYGSALALKRRMGDTSGVAIALANLGNALARKGEHAEARQHVHQAIALMEGSEHRETFAEACLLAGQVELTAGDVAQSWRYGMQSFELARTLGQRGIEAIARRALAEAALAEGRLDAAREHAEVASDMLKRQGHVLEWARARGVLARIRHRRGDAGGARQARSEALGAFQQLGAEPDRARLEAWPC